ncbi:hypothetical protein [Streptomyces sp. NPDC052114]|uniref:proline-rich domain-containing protein n=1 Tax=unclassified Streptomyces TaxID=2593676 RepID=UPI0034484F7A
MWQGQQPPGGEQNPQGPGQDPHHPEQNPYQPGQNPYQQPGYQQPNPYGGQAPHNAPTVPGGPRATAPAPTHGDGVGGGNGDGGGGGRTKLIALVAAGAVVVAAGVTGALLLGGDKDDTARPDPTASGSSAAPTGSADDNPRAGDGVPEPTVPGWKVVVNPKRGLAFDVPPEWSLESRDWAGGVVDEKDADDENAEFLAAFAAPAYFKEKWCASDDDKDGQKDYTSLAAAGTRGNRGARTTEEAARKDATGWVYGAYAQPEKNKVTTGPVTSYTTESGLKGSLVTATSSGITKEGECDSDGKATVFAFKDSGGEFASWSFHGAKGVEGELPDATVEKMLATVREYESQED